MKQNKIKLYALALAEIALAGKADKRSADNFLALVKKNGLEKKAKEIIVLAEDIILQKQGKRKIIFETARRLTHENRAELKKFVKEGDVVKEKVNHELIAGVKIVVDGNKQMDMSMQKKLNNIFS